MSILNKFKLRQDIKQKLDQEEEQRSGGRKKDTRIVPYYDLKFGEKIKVLIVPDENGNLWRKYSTHGPNLKLRGIEAVGCRRNNDKEDCPICQRGFDLLEESKQTGITELKDEAKRWFPKETTVMSVLVLESPIEIPISDDQNEVKLMYVPYAIESLIKNAMAEGQIDTDTILTTPLWIKKAIKKGTKDTPDYTSSYFDYRAQVSDDELSAFDDSVVEPFNYDELDLIPVSPSYEEAEDWVADAMEKDEKQKQRSSGSSKAGKGNDDDDSNVPVKKLASAAERLKAKRAQQEEPAQSDEEVTEEVEEVQEEPKTETLSRAQQLRERLAKQRNGG